MLSAVFTFSVQSKDSEKNSNVFSFSDYSFLRFSFSDEDINSLCSVQNYIPKLI